jgi:hypothetical protein
LFIRNAQAIKSDFFWQNRSIKRLAALLYSLEGKQINCGSIQECRKLIKHNTGIFSIFRGNMSLYVATMISLKSNREELLSNITFVYGMLKDAGFWASDYLAVAACQIAVNSKRDQYGQVVDRTKNFYNKLKAYHWVYIGRDDYIFAAMLGLSNIDTETGTQCIERFYQQLKPEFWSKNSVQALAQILALGGESDEVVNRVISLRNALRSQNIKLDKTYTLSSLGVLALLPVDADIIAQDIKNVLKSLRAQKGFGFFSVSTQELLLFAVAIVASGYTESMKNTAGIASVSTSIIIAQQTAAIIASTSSSAAAASSSSH